MSLLIMKLKLEQTTNKDWINDYLNVLPIHFNTPMYLSLDEIKMLQASQSFHAILLHVRSIARQYAYLVNFFDMKVIMLFFIQYFIDFRLMRSKFQYLTYLC